MSYPKVKRRQSCYGYEPWHWRYVGREREQEASRQVPGATCGSVRERPLSVLPGARRAQARDRGRPVGDTPRRDELGHVQALA